MAGKNGGFAGSKPVILISYQRRNKLTHFQASEFDCNHCTYANKQKT